MGQILFLPSLPLKIPSSEFPKILQGASPWWPLEALTIWWITNITNIAVFGVFV